MKGWKVHRLGDLSELITKGTTPTSVGHNFTEDGVNFVKVESITADGRFLAEKLAKVSEKCHADLRRSQLNPGDILFSIAGALGRTAFVTEEVVPANTNQALAIIRLKPSDEILPEFIMLALSSGVVLEQIEKSKGGVAQQNLSLAQLRDFQLVIPPLAEQQRIVGILDEAFAGLATAKANAEKNLQNARALFESHLQSVFSQRGEGWVEESLEALTVADAPITYGVVKPGDEGEVRFVRGGDLVRGKVRLTQLRTITKAVSNQYRRTLLKGGELLICLVGQPGQVGVAPKELAGANIARQVGLIRLKAIVDAEFVRYFLQSTPGAEALGARESGSVQQVINLGELRQVQVPYPPLTKQREIVAQLETIEAETTRLAAIYQQKLSALEELKKALLHQAFSGEL